MPRRHVVLVLVTGLAACKSDGTKPAALDCGDVLHAAIGRTIADVAGTSAPERAKVIAAIETTVTARCRDDGWSQAALACMASAADNAASRACEKEHLTVAQHDKVHAAIDKLGEPQKRAAVGAFIDEMAGFKDRVCACTDKACADAVMVEFEAYGKQLSKRAGAAGLPKMTAEEEARSKAISDELVACSIRTMKP